MQTQNTKRILGSLAAVAVLLVLVTWIIPQRKLSVDILDPKFHLLEAKISQGTTHKLDYDNGPTGQLMKLLKATGLKVGSSPLSVQTTNRSCALVARFIGGFTVNEFDQNQMWAEVVDGSGATTRCAPGQGYRLVISPYECGMIWLLASPPTNAVTLRLTHGNSQAPLAEIRVRGN